MSTGYDDAQTGGYRDSRLEMQGDAGNAGRNVSSCGRTVPKSNFVTDDGAAERFFSRKESIYAVKQKIEETLLQPTDGAFQGIWILTSIDHWNNDHEKVVVLTEKSVIVVKYDFITKRVKDSQKIILSMLKRIQVGNITFPPKSLVRPREHGGVRLGWGDMEEVTMVQKWNPICRTIPFITFAHHPLLYNKNETENTYYNVDEFLAALETALHSIPGSVPIIQEDIVIEVYGGVTSTIFNQSNLGFSKDRNGVSF